MIKCGANIHVKNIFGQSPLSFAFIYYKERPSMAKRLIELGAKISSDNFESMSFNKGDPYIDKLKSDFLQSVESNKS